MNLKYRGSDRGIANVQYFQEFKMKFQGRTHYYDHLIVL